MADFSAGPNYSLDGEPAQADSNWGQTDGDSRLAQRIWRRYGDSPGVIPMAVPLGLTGRVARFGAESLPLAADIYRRWLPAEASRRPGWPALPFAWQFDGAGSPSQSTYAAASSVETPRDDPGPSGPVTPADMASKSLMAPVMPGSGDAQHTAPVTSEITSVKISPGELGPAIIRRSADSPAPYAWQFDGIGSPSQSTYDAASSADTPLGYPGLSGPVAPADTASKPLLASVAPGSGNVQRTVPLARESTSVKISPAELGPAINRRSAHSPTRHAWKFDGTESPSQLTYDAASSADTPLGYPGPPGPVTPADTAGKPLMASVVPGSVTSESTSAKISPGELGPAIIRRGADSPARRTVQRSVISSESVRQEGVIVADVRQLLEQPTNLHRRPPYFSGAPDASKSQDADSDFTPVIVHAESQQAALVPLTEAPTHPDFGDTWNRSGGSIVSPKGGGLEMPILQRSGRTTKGKVPALDPSQPERVESANSEQSAKRPMPYQPSAIGPVGGRTPENTSSSTETARSGVPTAPATVLGSDYSPVSQGAPVQSAGDLAPIPPGQRLVNAASRPLPRASSLSAIAEKPENPASLGRTAVGEIAQETTVSGVPSRLGDSGAAWNTREKGIAYVAGLSPTSDRAMPLSMMESPGTPILRLAEPPDREFPEMWSETTSPTRSVDEYGNHGAVSLMPLRSPPGTGSGVGGPLVLAAPPAGMVSSQAGPGAVSQGNVSRPLSDNRPSADTPVVPAAALEVGATGETEVDDLVDKVMRKLTRRLAVESERRGWRRWL